MTNLRIFARGVQSTAAALAVAIVAIPRVSSGDTLSDFQITPSALGGPARTVTADKITGGYGETFTVTSATDFTTDAYWYAGQFFSNDGLSAVLPGVSGLGVDYDLYAVFSADSRYKTDGSGNSVFTATSGTISLYVDYLTPQTTFTLPADASTGDVTVSGDTDPDFFRWPRRHYILAQDTRIKRLIVVTSRSSSSHFRSPRSA